MPYIKKDERIFLDPFIKELDNHIDKIGKLNYVMTKLGVLYVKRRKKSYFVFLIVIGTFICACLEFYRRWVAPYEDIKIQENGDVW